MQSYFTAKPHAIASAKVASNVGRERTCWLWAQVGEARFWGISYLPSQLEVENSLVQSQFSFRGRASESPFTEVVRPCDCHAAISQPWFQGLPTQTQKAERSRGWVVLSFHSQETQLCNRGAGCMHDSWWLLQEWGFYCDYFSRRWVQDQTASLLGLSMKDCLHGFFHAESVESKKANMIHKPLWCWAQTSGTVFPYLFCMELGAWGTEGSLSPAKKKERKFIPAWW